MIRKIIHINEEKCNGCGACASACHEGAIGMVNGKTTAVRVIPAIGRNIGDELEFGGLLGSGPVMKVNTKSPAKFINRGGKIPAPLHSLKN